MDRKFENAEDALAAYLDRVGQGEVLDFDAYCAAWPRWRDEMHRKLGELARLGSLVNDVANRPALREPAPAPETELGPSLTRTLDQLGGGLDFAQRYELRGELGRGGMGVVLRAWDRVLKRDVAVKRIHGGGASNSGAPRSGSHARGVGRFVDEAQITAQLDHASIVPIHDIGFDEQGQLYFTMRLITGSTLGEIFERVRAQREGWSLTRALGLLLRVCEALAFAHHKGVVHRDLKPTNVMVGRFGEVYVMDWGLARLVDLLDGVVAKQAKRPVVDDSTARSVQSDRRSDRGSGSGVMTHDGDIVGTPAYMSPEQAWGNLERIGPKSDVYALGAILYELLAGRSPYSDSPDANRASEMLERLRMGPPTSLEQLAPTQPAELVAICNRAMERDASRRYATMDALADELRAYLEGRVVLAHRSDLWTIAVKWAKRNRALSSTVAAALVVTVAGTALFLVRLQDEVAAKKAAYDDLDARTRERDRVNHRLHAEELVTRADALFPAVPAQVPALEAWLQEAERLASDGRARDYDRELRRTDNSEQVALELERVRASLGELERVRGEVAQRLERARTYERRSITEHAEAWDEAVAAIADSPVYTVAGDGWLEIEPQPGLIPLGENPQSGLWEFWLLDTGEPPQHLEPTDGNWRIDAETAVVLVLAPGHAHEEPPIEPFFFGKYEVTQGQWRRVMGANPADKSASRPHVFSKSEITFDDRHPVENISWPEAYAFCERLQLALPPVAQWEYLARGGSGGERWTGDDEMSLLGRESVRFDPEDTGYDGADSFPFHAPVGSFAPNPFGAFDVLGNVSEWCAEAAFTRPADIVTFDAPVSRCMRGGNFQLELVDCTTSYKPVANAYWRNYATGLRVVRALDP